MKFNNKIRANVCIKYQYHKFFVIKSDVKTDLSSRQLNMLLINNEIELHFANLIDKIDMKDETFKGEIFLSLQYKIFRVVKT